PGYMSPEQLRGEQVDERGDQFGFCVALYEAIYGTRPFAGESVAELAAATLEGVVEEAPDFSAAPKRLRAVLQRGIDVEPEARWPSMDALLLELEQLIVPRARRWLTRGLLVGMFGGVTAVAVTVPQYLAIQDRCEGAQSKLVGVWDDTRRQQVEDAVLATSAPEAPDAWARIEPRLDDYAQAWAGEHTEVCKATAVRGEQTEEAMDLRMGCLHARKVALDAAVTVLADADETVVPKSVEILEGLPRLRQCDDLDQLRQQRRRVRPPLDPAVAVQVDAVRETLAAVHAENSAGRLARAHDQAQTLVAKAQELQYEPLLAEILLELGQIAQQRDQTAEAKQRLHKALELAAKHGHDAITAEAAALLASSYGVDDQNYERGLAWATLAIALGRGPGVGPETEAKAHTSLGIMQWRRDEPAKGLEHLREALAIRERASGPEHSSVGTSLNNMGLLLRSMGKIPEALEHYRRSLAILERALGPHHLHVANPLLNIGNELSAQQSLPEALEYTERALAIKVRALGQEHSEVAQIRLNLGIVHARMGNNSEGLAHLEQALATYERIRGPDHPSVAETATNIAALWVQQNEPTKALQYYSRARAIREETFGPQHSLVAECDAGIATALWTTGDRAEALRRMQHAVDIQERQLGVDNPTLQEHQFNLGLMLLRMGKPAEALPHQERALAALEAKMGDDDTMRGKSLIILAEIHLELGEIEAARARAQAAVEVFRAHPEIEGTLAAATDVLARIERHPASQ
ncbi:MAG: tetratricopeptide repeat protein, partial [Deltaproteobacteria bacterium]|nr:tetratricopeptide repeat protein [Deltaproteobacteria bacterium]